MANIQLIVHTDGGARGNPGPAAVGVVIEHKGTVPHHTGALPTVTFGKQIGVATNNVAEYAAVVEALTYLVGWKHKQGNTDQIGSIEFYLDSTLVVNQLNGLFKVKEPHLRDLLTRVRILEADVGGAIHYISVPRAQNWQADLLVNQALDG